MRGHHYSTFEIPDNFDEPSSLNKPRNSSASMSYASFNFSVRSVLELLRLDIFGGSRIKTFIPMAVQLVAKIRVNGSLAAPIRLSPNDAITLPILTRVILFYEADMTDAKFADCIQ